MESVCLHIGIGGLEYVVDNAENTIFGDQPTNS